MMDSIACTRSSKDTSNQSHDSGVTIKNDGDVAISKNIDSQSPKARMMIPLGPVTPVSSKEIGDVTFNLISSPFTKLDKCDDNAMFISPDCSSPKTPSNVVFDPFAPGLEDMVLAPRCKKPVRRPKLSVSRCLDFDSSTDSVSFSDDEIIEFMCANFLKVIISVQTGGFDVDFSKPEWELDNDCKTPTSAPRINGIAETCPGAPMKTGGKSKNIDLELCKKLDF